MFDTILRMYRDGDGTLPRPHIFVAELKQG
jgi:hypothetical protein